MRAAELGLALALDTALGEPPGRLHPVVWMGRLVDLLEELLPAPRSSRAVAGGGVATGVGSAVVLLSALAARRAPWPLRAALLWGLLAGRLLRDEAAAVERALADGGLVAGRERVAWLVSRDTTALDGEQVRAAAVQSLAENTTDAWVATLWWWSVAGLPGAALHRWADTLDSRWGYLDEDWADRGRVAARTDDLLAWLPARLTGVTWRGRLDAALRREAARPPSPNGGWPMGAAALALDTRLEKPGAYVLHPGGRCPDASTIARALQDARRVHTTTAAAALVAAALVDRRARRHEVAA